MLMYTYLPNLRYWVECSIFVEMHLSLSHVNNRLAKITKQIVLRRVWRYQKKVIRICKSKKDRQYNDLQNFSLSPFFILFSIIFLIALYA